MKNLKPIICACSMALVFAACNKNETEPVPVPVPAGQKIQITASCTSPKTVNDGLDTKWSNSDSLCVMHKAKSDSAYIMDGAFIYVDGTGSTFEGNVMKARIPDTNYVWKALYPYSPAMSTSISDGVVLVGGYQAQNGLNNMSHLAGNGFPIWGSCETTGLESPSLTMTNLCAIAEINVVNNSGFPVTISGLDLTFPEEYKTRGKYTINLDGDAPVLTYQHSGANTTHLEVYNTSPIANGDSAKFYLGIAPNVLAAGSVIKLKINSFEKTLTLPADIAFTSGHIRKIKIPYVGNPNTLYIVDSNNLVLTMTKTSPTEYRTTSLSETRNIGPTFRIAEKVNGTAIDPTGFVIGGEDYHTLSKIAADGTPITKPAVYFKYGDSKPDGILFDIDKMALNFVTVLDYNTMGNTDDYKVRWVCAMPKNSIVEFINFDSTKKLSERIANDRFDSIDDTKSTARYIGMDINCEAYAIKPTGWINFWEMGGSEGAVLLIGKVSSIPLAPFTNGGYTLSEGEFCAKPWKTLYMTRISEKVYRVKIYLDWTTNAAFGFYFYSDRAWAKCIKGWTSGSAILGVGNPDGDYPYAKPGTGFTIGVYTVELNMDTKVVTMY